MIPEMGKRLSLSGVFSCAGITLVLLVVLLEVSSKSTKTANAARQLQEKSGIKIVQVYPHDPKAYTQGLLYSGNNTLYESTGLYGQSSVREVDLQTGKVRRISRMQNSDFGEGLTLWENKFLQLTWRTNKGYFYDGKSLSRLGTFKHPMTDGWGLTHDGEHIIGSDGTSILYFLDPNTFSEIRRISVLDKGQAVEYLNELEYVKGEIWANVYLVLEVSLLTSLALFSSLQSDSIARISPQNGSVLGWIDLEELRKELISAGNVNIEVLNGIAWDEEQDRIFVTGKLWPKLYQIVVSPNSSLSKAGSIRSTISSRESKAS